MIYHIAFRDAWSAAAAKCVYKVVSLEKEGFIHCSTREQVLPVANTWYRGRRGLVLLQIDEARLTSPLKWEPGTDKPEENFPHIHGALNTGAVTGVFPFEPAPDGSFSMPDESLNGQGMVSG